MSYESVNCKPEDLYTLRRFLQEGARYLGVTREGFYLASKGGPNRVSRMLAFVTSETFLLRSKIESGEVTDEELAVLGDFLIAQYGD